MTTFDLFSWAERMEAASAAIYAKLAKQFAADAGARALFSRLEAEELEHGKRIKLFASQYRHDPRLAMKVGDEAALDRGLAEVEKALTEVEEGRWGDDLPRIKERLVVLEARLAAAHAHALASGAPAGLREFFRMLERQDTAHGELLKRPSRRSRWGRRSP